MSDFARQTSLLALEQVERHSVGVVRVEQLLLFASQDGEPPLLGGTFALAVQAQLAQFFFKEGPHRDQLVIRKLDAQVVGGDRRLDLLDPQRPLLAGRSLLGPPAANEVRIRATTAFGHADEQATAALPAEDAALEVVRVLSVLFAGQVLGRQ